MTVEFLKFISSSQNGMDQFNQSKINSGINLIAKKLKTHQKQKAENEQGGKSGQVPPANSSKQRRILTVVFGVNISFGCK